MIFCDNAISMRTAEKASYLISGERKQNYSLDKQSNQKYKNKNS